MGKKQNSAIGAVIGGALLGPFGVAIGAALGAMHEDESIALHQANNQISKYDFLDVQEEMKKILTRYSSDDLYKTEGIPQKKREAAIQNYPVPRQEIILALIDGTLFGSAKVGMAIGLQGIYWKNDWTTETAKNFLSWEEMAKSTQSIGVKAISSDLLLGSGCVFNLSGSQVKAKYLAELLNEIIALYKATQPSSTLLDSFALARTSNLAQAFPEKINKTVITQDVISDVFFMLHYQSLDSLTVQMQGNDDSQQHDVESDFLLGAFYSLLDEQIKIVMSRINIIKSAVGKAEGLSRDSDLIAPTLGVSIFIFMVMHNYSLSKLPKEFLDGLGDDTFLQTFAIIYAMAFLDALDDSYRGNTIDSQAINSIPLMLFDRNAEERFNLKMPKSEFLIGLLGSLST